VCWALLQTHKGCELRRREPEGGELGRLNKPQEDREARE